MPVWPRALWGGRPLELSKRPKSWPWASKI
jgi:hypothetical protein